MLPPRILGLLVILLAVQGLCKPTKSVEDDDYEDDTPVEEEDEEDEDEEADNIGTPEMPPQIVSRTQSIRVEAGSTVKLPCEVINAENYAVAWFKDGKYLYVESQAHIDDYKRIVRLPNNSLMIYNASVEDSSNEYKCSILRDESSIDLTHRVLVDPGRTHQQPAASSPPPQHSHKGIIRVTPSKRVEVKEGHRIRLGCETDIQPPPEIKWFIESKKVDDPDVVQNGNYITIKKVNKSHSGQYQCLVEDDSETPAMEGITVVVHYIPSIEVERSVVHSGPGIESEMTCIVNACPEAIISWYKDDKPVTHKKGIVMRHGPSVYGNKTKHTLRILHTKTHDFGEYKCRAQNTIGDDVKSIFLTGAPSKATTYSTEMANNDAEIILKWRLESYSPISEYKLQYRRKGDEDWKFAEPEVKDGKGNQFVVEHPIGELQPGSYEAILMARNPFGWSQPSEPLLFNGDYPPDLALKDGNSATVRSSATLLTLILVVLSCAFTSL